MAAKSFGVWLFDKRRDQHLTQQELARLAGCTKQYISNLERNAPHPVTGALPKVSRKKLDDIAGALGVSLSEARLAAGYAPPERDQRDVGEARLLGYFKEMPQESRFYLEVIAEALWRKARERKKKDDQAA